MRRRFAGPAVLAAVLLLGVTPPPAGTAQGPPALIPPVRVEVTGNPAPVETLRLAIITAARAQILGAPGGQVSLVPQETSGKVVRLWAAR